MRRPETQLGAGGGAFPSTSWTMVLAAGGSPREREACLSFLVERYWRPVYHYFRRRGEAVEDAKDLTQEFFTRLVGGEFVERANPELGRFRTYCLTALDRFHSNAKRDRTRKKRRPAAALVSIDLGDDDEPSRVLADPRAETPEAEFDRRWAAEVVREALARTRARTVERSSPAVYEAFRQRVFEGLSSSEIATRTGIPADRVDNHVYRIKQVFKSEIREVVRATVGEERLVEEEIRHLRHLIGGV